MRNFFYRISSAMARLMYGRNGADQLGSAMLVLYGVLFVFQTLFARFRGLAAILEVLSLLVAVLLVFRMFSKNLAKRGEENAKFLNWWLPKKNYFAACRQRRLDKEHKYFTCKNCKTICRVPAGKGKIEITCPKCGGKLIVKS